MYGTETHHFSSFDNCPSHVRCDARCVSDKVRHSVLRMELERTTIDTPGDM